MVYNIYAFGNADLMAAMMQGMASLTTANMYQTAIVLALLIGFVVMIFNMMSVTVGRAHVLGKHILMVLIFCSVGINHTVTVNIQNLDGSQPRNIDHVPFAVAGTAWLMSSIGYHFAKGFDQAYSGISNVPIDLLASSGVPMGAANEFILAANNYHLQDRHLSQSIRYWMTDCVPPAIAQNQTSLADLYNAPKLLEMLGATIAGTSEGVHTLYYGSDHDKDYCSRTQLSTGETSCKSSQGAFVTCKAAYTAIKSSLNNQSTNMVNQFMYQATSGLSSEIFSAVIEHNIGNKDYAPTAGQYLQQSALMKLLSNLKGDVAARIDDQMMMQAFAVAKAENATIASWSTQSSVFRSTFGYIFSLIQIMLYAISPIIILLALVGGFGMQKLKNWFLLMLWVPVTFIMIVLIQAISSSITQSDLQFISSHMNGFNLNSVDYISAKAQLLLAAAQNMETVAPLFAVSLIFGGSMAITSFLSHTGSATFGANAGAEAATGTAAADNISLRNTRADQTTLSQSISTGARPVNVDSPSGTPLLTNDLGGTVNKANNAAFNQQETFTGGFHGGSGSNQTQSVGQGGSLLESALNQHDYTKTGQYGGQNSTNLGVNADLGGLLKGGMSLAGAGTSLAKTLTLGGASAAVATATVSQAQSSNIEMGENILSSMNVTGADDTQKAMIGGMVAQYDLAKQKGDMQTANSIMGDMNDTIGGLQQPLSPSANDSAMSYQEQGEVLWDRFKKVDENNPIKPHILTAEEQKQLPQEKPLTDLYPVAFDIAGAVGLAKAAVGLGKLGVEYGLSKLGKGVVNLADDAVYSGVKGASKVADDIAYPYGKPHFPHGKLPEPTLVKTGEYVPLESSVKFSKSTGYGFAKTTDEVETAASKLLTGSSDKTLTSTLGAPKFSLTGRTSVVAEGAESAAQSASRSGSGYSFSQATKTSAQVTKEAEAVAETATKSGMKGLLTAVGAGTVGATGVGIGFKHYAENTNAAKETQNYAEKTSTNSTYQNNHSVSRDYGQTASHIYTVTYSKPINGGGVTPVFNSDSEAETMWRNQNAIQNNQNLSSQTKDLYAKLHKRAEAIKSHIKDETDKGIRDVNSKSDALLPLSRGDKPKVSD